MSKLSLIYNFAKFIGYSTDLIAHKLLKRPEIENPRKRILANTLHYLTKCFPEDNLFAFWLTVTLKLHVFVEKFDSENVISHGLSAL